jgi:NAD(P)-dependent dehydrogenase (short-subunit alcohol dehydrogenase family)
MDLQLQGIASFVTGGSAGIGRATALTLAAEGARVAISYHRNKDAAHEVAERITSSGGEAHVVRMELDDLDSVDEAVTAVVDRWEGLDVLVGNAVQWGSDVANAWTDRIEDASVESWQEILRANLEGNLRAVQVAAPALRRSGSGRVVLLSSDLAERGMPGSWHYSAAKAGLAGLVASLTPDLGRDGVLVNVVMPGITPRDGHHQIVPDDELAELARTLPARRLATVEDVASAIAFLGSPRNAGTTGEIIRVNGGSAYAAA